jgi:hypothetical protein
LRFWPERRNFSATATTVVVLRGFQSSFSRLPTTISKLNRAFPLADKKESEKNLHAAALL